MNEVLGVIKENWCVIYLWSFYFFAIVIIFMANTRNFDKLSLIISIMSIIVSSFISGWALSNTIKVNNLQRAEVVFSEEGFVKRDIKDSKGNFLHYELFVNLNNIGRAAAEDIRYKIYSIYFNEKNGMNSERAFNDKLIHKLNYGETATLGAFVFRNNDISMVNNSCEAYKINENTSLLKDEYCAGVILVYKIEYTDTFKDEEVKDIYWFYHKIGSNRVKSLSKYDAERIGRERFEEFFKNNENDKEDQKELLEEVEKIFNKN